MQSIPGRSRLAAVLFRIALACLLTGCAAAPMAAPADSGSPDASTPDAGTPDAGTPDAGTPDAGTPDAGTPDAGTPDAGTPDGGTGGGTSGILFTDNFNRTLTSGLGPAWTVLNGQWRDDGKEANSDLNNALDRV